MISENLVVEDELMADLADLEKKIIKHGSENILAVVSTTSCFAPRSPDDVIKIAKLCKKFNIPHVVNNAYGLQCDEICKKIRKAIIY